MNKIGLYLHVPFCRKKCRYCDFYSLADRGDALRFAEKLASFLAVPAEECDGLIVDTVYLGGGTPSLLPPRGIETVFAAVHAYFSLAPDAEITAEANPESLTEEVLAAFRDAGVNRLSLGMQSADDGELRMLGRIHTAADTRAAVERARRAGFENLNLDLMYGLPDQKPEAFFSGLETALSYEPEHLSFYALTLSEEVPLYAGRDRLPGEEEQLAMYLGAIERLEKRGLYQYEISNAARPGFASRHNLRYWRREEYLGVGPGAWSYRNGERFAMAPDLDRFLAAKDPRDLIGEREIVDRAGEIEEEIVLSLRLTEGLDEARLSALAGPEITARVLEKLARRESAGLTLKTKNGYRLTPRGFFVSNGILADLI